MKVNMDKTTKPAVITSELQLTDAVISQVLETTSS